MSGSDRARRAYRAATILLARIAVARGDHAEAAKLYAEADVRYVHEIQIYERRDA